MARSMTGFGQAHQEIDGIQYVVEIRSVNGRYFKATFHLPEVWAHLEADIESQLRSQLHRGSIYFTLRTRSVSAEAAYEVNVAALEKYVELLDAIRPDQSDLKLTADLSALLLLPGVCNPPEPDSLREKVAPRLLKLIDKAIGALLVMRQREGQALTANLMAHCLLIQSHLEQVASAAGRVVQDYHQRLKRRVEELTAAAELKIDEKDLAREVAVFAERCDIAEEIARLGAHLAQFRAAQEHEDQPGRKLDFIAQEMLREANTIAAKANDAQIATSVVEIKTAVDRIKEQVQNVE